MGERGEHQGVDTVEAGVGGGFVGGRWPGSVLVDCVGGNIGGKGRTSLSLGDDAHAGAGGPSKALLLLLVDKIARGLVGPMYGELPCTRVDFSQLWL
jgi:hypothetical protein